MITASHNAPRYNGVKLKGAFGGSALPEQCRRVEVYINDNEEQARGPNLMDLRKAREAGLIQKFNPLPTYFDHLRTLINTDVIADNPQRFVVDAMYGSGRGVIKSFLQGTGCEVGGEKVSEISQRDGVKYIMSDDSWLLIRPSGTEPVLRVYAEGRTQEMVRALLGYGEQVAKSVV